MIPRTGAGDVQQMALGVGHLFQIRGISSSFDPLLRRNDLVIAGHHYDGPELQAFARCMVLMET